MAPLWGAGGRYDPDYPVCMEVVDTSGGRIECHFTSIEQCRQRTFGTGGTCFNNPNCCITAKNLPMLLGRTRRNPCLRMTRSHQAEPALPAAA